MGVRGFRGALRAVVPVWLSERPAFKVGFQFLYTTVGLFDYAAQALLEGARASMPGSDSRTDNLAAVGTSRMRLQGETQSNPSFVGTLQNWLVDLREMGDDAGLAKELHRWLGGNPMVRVITRAGYSAGTYYGRYTTCAVDGTVTRVTAPWDWDSRSIPGRNTSLAGMPGCFDAWIVIYPVAGSGYYGSSSGHWGDGQGAAPLTKGIGVVCTPAEIDTIRGLISQWCGAHINVRTLVWSYDPLAFDPSTPSRAGNPDGTWGRWSNVATCLASRNRLHRYTSIGPERPGP